MREHTEIPVDSVRLREAKLADVAELVRLVNLAFEREAWLIPGPRVTLAELTFDVMDPSAVVMVAELDRALGGILRARLDGPDSEGPYPSLGLLAVHPDAQRRGLGAKLVASGEDAARHRRIVHLQCGRELGMERFYERLGYEVVAVEFGRHFGSTQPFSLITMRKVLTAVRSPR